MKTKIEAAKEKMMAAVGMRERVRRRNAFCTSHKGKVLWFGARIREIPSKAQHTNKDTVEVLELQASTYNKYSPHQGKRECARRLAKMESNHAR